MRWEEILRVTVGGHLRTRDWPLVVVCDVAARQPASPPPKAAHSHDGVVTGSQYGQVPVPGPRQYQEDPPPEQVLLEDLTAPLVII